MKHGDCNTRLYKIWSNMRNRCNNQFTEMFKYCGAKGIIVCSEWDNFVNFKTWALENGYTNELFIKRKDKTKNFESSNCSWVDKQINCLKNLKLFDFQNKITTYKELSRIYNISIGTLRQRYNKGWRNEKLVQPVFNTCPKKY